MFYLDPETQKRYTIGRPFSYGDINYTKAGATHATFVSLGFTQVIPQQRPSDEFYIVSGPNADGSYNATPRDIDQLKENQVSKQKSAAGSLLSPTDWYVIRATEDPECVCPPEVAQYRADVRTVSGQREAQINACVDVVELEALTKAPAQIVEDPEAEELVIIPNPAALTAWPEQL